MLLGQACDHVERHRATVERKAPPPRQCTSLPSSRHHSMEDLPGAVKNGHLSATTGSKSTPHTPHTSQSSSLADISAQAAIMQETLENSMILSDSQVSLHSLDMISEGLRRAKLLEVINEGNNGTTDAVTGGLNDSILIDGSAACRSSSQPGQTPTSGRCLSAGLSRAGHGQKSILRERNCGSAENVDTNRRRVSLQEGHSNAIKFEYSEQDN